MMTSRVFFYILALAIIGGICQAIYYHGCITDLELAKKNATQTERFYKNGKLVREVHEVSTDLTGCDFTQYDQCTVSHP